MGKEYLQTQLTEVDIKREIEEARRTDPFLIHYFNNFYGNFPGQFYRKLFGRIVLEDGRTMLDVPISEIVKEDEGFSEKYRSQTYRDFFSEIDHVLETETIDIERFSFVVENREQYAEEFINLQTTPFIVLRLRGYRRYPDLIA